MVKGMYWPLEQGASSLWLILYRDEASDVNLRIKLVKIFFQAGFQLFVRKEQPRGAQGATGKRK